MPEPPLTDFAPDPERLAPLLPCMGAGTGWDPDAEWPCNLLSRGTVVYGDGKIARAGDPVNHRVDPDELALCRRLAAKAAAQPALSPERDYHLFDFFFDTESGDFRFSPFFVAADVGAPVPDRIDAELVRAKFGGTIFPPARITVAPLVEGGKWWEETGRGEGHYGADLRDMLADGEPPEGGEGFAEEVRDTRALVARNLAAMREFMRWFTGRPEFKDVAFVAVGDHWGEGSIRTIPEREWPPGTRGLGSVFLRLVVGLTRAGSLVGLVGHVVQT